MYKNRYFFLFLFILAFIIGTFLTGCLTTGGSIVVAPEPAPEQGTPPPAAGPGPGENNNGHGPPPHAPAHGYHKKFQYRYYPDEFVYFDINRSVYFFIENGVWTISAVLPGVITLSTNFVSLELNIEKPYLENKKHKKKYPPVKNKKGKNKKNKKNKRD